MASAGVQKRYLTQPTSKLAKSNITTLLRKDDAWALLPEETGTHLYSLLPAPAEGGAPNDPDVHPLNTAYKPYIEEELRRWQEDLKEGREQKKWREEAMQAARDRLAGKFDEGVGLLREEYWGASAAGKEEKSEVDGKENDDTTVDAIKENAVKTESEMDGDAVEMVVKASAGVETEAESAKEELGEATVASKAEESASDE